MEINLDLSGKFGLNDIKKSNLMTYIDDNGNLEMHHDSGFNSEGKCIYCGIEILKTEPNNICKGRYSLN